MSLQKCMTLQKKVKKWALGTKVPISILCGLRKSFNKHKFQASLVAQWLRICLPMQGTRVRALVREDPTCN